MPIYGIFVVLRYLFLMYNYIVYFLWPFLGMWSYLKGSHKTSNNDNSFGIKINEQSAIIKELTDKYSKFNIDDIIETRIKQTMNIIQTDTKKVLDVIPNSFT